VERAPFDLAAVEAAGALDPVAEALEPEPETAALPEEGLVDVGRGTEEVRVTPTAAQRAWAASSAAVKSLPEHVVSMHWVAEVMKGALLHKQASSLTAQLP